MEYQVEKEKDRILVILPITTPTGKVRVKRPQEGFAAGPLACRVMQMQESDYLEWQIIYDTDDLHEPSIVREVVLQKQNGGRYGCELIRFIVEGVKLKLISVGQFERIRSILLSDIAGIEETERILKKEMSAARETVGEIYGFTRFYLYTPNYVKEGTKYSVEIKIAHKQKAVGNQAMIFLNIPIEYCLSQNGTSLVGRTSERKEKVIYTIDKSNCNLIYDTTLAFVIASERHRRE